MTQTMAGSSWRGVESRVLHGPGTECPRPRTCCCIGSSVRWSEQSLGGRPTLLPGGFEYIEGVRLFLSSSCLKRLHDGAWAVVRRYPEIRMFKSSACAGLWISFESLRKQRIELCAGRRHL